MDTSPLQKLPGELRNRIHELILCHTDTITVSISTGVPKLVSDPTTQQMLALTTTCRQLRREASPIFYEINKFTFVAKQVGEQYVGSIRDDKNTQWQVGLRRWLDQIGERNCAHLRRVEVDVGTSFMYNYVPSTESIWRSVAGVLSFFSKQTQVNMRTEFDWTYESRRAFTVSVPLSDPDRARIAVDKALEEQRRELRPWCESNHTGARRATYMKVELETCAQELQSFISLLEIMSLNGMQ